VQNKIKRSKSNRQTVALHLEGRHLDRVAQVWPRGGGLVGCAQKRPDGMVGETNFMRTAEDSLGAATPTKPHNKNCEIFALFGKVQSV